MTSNQIYYAFVRDKTFDLTHDKNIFLFLKFLVSRLEYNSKNHVLVRRYKKGQLASEWKRIIIYFNSTYKILQKFKDRFALFDFRFSGNIFIAMAQIG